MQRMRGLSVSALVARTIMCAQPIMCALPIMWHRVHVMYALTHSHALILHVCAVGLLLCHALAHVVAHEIGVLMVSHVCSIHVNVMLGIRIA